MADNIDVTPGSGKTVATDDVGGFHYQRVKVSHGADGSATDTSAADPFPVAGPTGARVAATLTRPGDGNVYAANDCVANATSGATYTTFSNVARVNAGSGYVVKARLVTNQSTCTARFRLHLFHTAPTAINDNAAFTLLDADKANKVGELTFPSAVTEGSGSDAAYAQLTPGGQGGVPLHFVAAGGSRTLYGLLETLDAFTPASSQTFWLELSGDLD